MTRITAIRALDIRFPTSRSLDGSDAMNLAPDYSAAYCIIETDGPHQGHGLTFTIGRGTDLCVAAINGLGKHLILGGAGIPTRIFHHGGSNDSYRAWIEGYPAHGDGFVILTNGAGANTKKTARSFTARFHVTATRLLRNMTELYCQF